jgi:hypothetical protein
VHVSLAEAVITEVVYDDEHMVTPATKISYGKSELVQNLNVQIVFRSLARVMKQTFLKRVVFCYLPSYLRSAVYANSNCCLSCKFKLCCYENNIFVKYICTSGVGHTNKAAILLPYVVHSRLNIVNYLSHNSFAVPKKCTNTLCVLFIASSTSKCQQPRHFILQ